MRDDVITISATYQHHTQRGLLVELDNGEEVWLPLSQIKVTERPERPTKGDTMTIEVPEWLAKDKGIE